jgi:prephenate dehydratase
MAILCYQGEPGANSHIACHNLDPKADLLPCATFEDCFAAVSQHEADLAVIPVENSVAGRVADIHHLLPLSDLHIVGEYFLPIHHQLLGLPGTSLDTIKTVYSHVMALGQCRKFIKAHKLIAHAQADTAGSARIIRELKNPQICAIASTLAAEVHELDILAENIEDEAHNTTRFLLFARNGLPLDQVHAPCMTSFVFKVRNVPAALYKALGGFATNGVNMTKLESYQIDGQFFATQFYADVEGHPADRSLQLALEELRFFAEVKILGTYPMSDFRFSAKASV